MRFGRLCEIELAERLLELAAHTIEWRMRVGGDRGAYELQREPDRPSLERRQPGRLAERVAPDFLVDPDLVSVELGVDGVTAAAEVDEIEQRKVLLQLVLGDVEALDELRRGNSRARRVAATLQEVGQQRLQDGETLGLDRPWRALADAIVLGRHRSCGWLERLAGMAVSD